MSRFTIHSPAILFVAGKQNREQTGTALKLLGNSQVMEAEDLATGLAMVKKNPESMLILDWQGIPSVRMLDEAQDPQATAGRPVFMIVEEEPDHFLAVMSDYTLAGKLPGPVVAADMVRLLRRYFEDTSDKTRTNQALERARISRQQGQMKRALETLQALRRKVPGNSQVALETADLLIAMENWPEAGKIIDETMREHPTVPRVMHLKARWLLHEERRDEAASFLNRSLLLNPLHCDRLLSLGQMLLRMDRSAEAEARFQEALRINPELSPARIGVGTSRLLQESPEAMEFIGDLRSEQEKAAIFNSAGVINVGFGKFTEARKLYDLGLAFISGNHLRARVTFNKCLAWLKEGQLQNAETEAYRSMELDPSFERAGDLLMQIKARITGGGEGEAAARKIDFDVGEIETVMGADFDDPI